MVLGTPRSNPGSIESTGARSFLKWAGGKTRVASTIAGLVPKHFGTYIEPFCGSAAVFFALQPARAVLNDANEELVICLRAVRDDPDAVMARLNRMPNTRDHFNKVRKQKSERLSEVDRAARLIYLNKTAFRGLWRVNRRGEFNTPYGEYQRPYYNPATLLAASWLLRSAELRCEDFDQVLRSAKQDDWVYLDPPYVPDRKWGDFTRYTAGRFGPDDQCRLAESIQRLDRKGVRWLMTNSDTAMVRELYSDFNLAILPTRREITLRSADRESRDLIVANYEFRPDGLVRRLPLLRRK
ncbi:MAG: DNA adenine methylase [Actinomycetota bacterium]